MIVSEVIKVKLRECWILASDRRMSAQTPGWTTQPTIHAIVVEWVWVHEKHRQQGHLKRFLAELCADARFDMVVVEMVQNPILAAALTRWGWESDLGVKDFFKRRGA